MDWKKEAVDKLKNYEAKKSSLVRSTEEINRLEDILTNIRSATTDGTPVSGGGGSGRETAVSRHIGVIGENIPGYPRKLAETEESSRIKR